MTHGFKMCAIPDGTSWQECDECVQIAIRATMARSPLAIRIFGFAEVFRSQWGFLPEGVSDDDE